MNLNLRLTGGGDERNNDDDRARKGRSSEGQWDTRAKRNAANLETQSERRTHSDTAAEVARDTAAYEAIQVNAHAQALANREGAALGEAATDSHPNNDGGDQDDSEHGEIRHVIINHPERRGLRLRGGGGESKEEVNTLVTPPYTQQGMPAWLIDICLMLLFFLGTLPSPTQASHLPRGGAPPEQIACWQQISNGIDRTKGIRGVSRLMRLNNVQRTLVTGRDETFGPNACLLDSQASLNICKNKKVGWDFKSCKPRNIAGVEAASEGMIATQTCLMLDSRLPRSGSRTRGSIRWSG